MAPYRAAFSDTGKRLAVLYRPPNLSNSNQFSLLRVYSTQDGSVIDIFGSFDQTCGRLRLPAQQRPPLDRLC